MKTFTPKFLLSYGIIFFAFAFNGLQAQLGLCNGNSGNPIFTEDFGSGRRDVPLTSGTTTYTFARRGTLPSDGSYKVTSFTQYFSWPNIDDHTPGDNNGRMLLVNADDASAGGEFFRLEVPNLCGGTTYEFSSWLVNLITPSNPPKLPVNVKFEILDPATNTVLRSGDTGNIGSTPTIIWRQYGLVFTTPPGQTSVVLVLSNNGRGGGGNDLALDDIVFRTCGDNLNLTDNIGNADISVCQSELGSNPIILNPNPDGTIFSSYAYQWQVSTNDRQWTNISGENNATLTLPNTIGTRFYRVVVAENAANLGNDQCTIFSASYRARVNPNPAAPRATNPNVSACTGETAIASVSVPRDIRVNWYNMPNGGAPLLTNDPNFATTVAGDYYAEAVSTNGCISTTRTRVNVAFLPTPPVNNESLNFCGGDPMVLSANVSGTGITYFWVETSETTESITVTTPGTYTVEVTSSNGCTSTKTITVVQNPAPSAPVPVNTNVDVCETGNTDLSVTVPNGIQVNWYDAQGDLFEQNTTTISPPLSGSYFAEAIDSATNCVSLNRTEIILTINPLPDAPLTDNRPDFLCSNELEDISVTVPQGIQVDWYDAPVGGNLLLANNTTFTVTGSGTFYAEAVNPSTPSRCTSLMRTAITVVVGQAPAAPLGVSPPPFCENEEQSVTVTVPQGIVVDWYDMNGNLLLPNNNTLSTTTPGTFYAEAIDPNTGCISDRTEITFTQNPSPDAPMVDSPTTFCGNGEESVTVTVPNGIQVNWYAQEMGGNPLLEDNTTFSTSISGTYYAEAINSLGCVSERTPITITINPVPDAPGGMSPGEVCGDGSFTIVATVPQGLQVNWYDSETADIPLFENNPEYSVISSDTYYAEAIDPISGCVSERTAFEILFVPLPEVTDEDFTLCDGNTLVLSAGTTADSYLWSTGESTQEITVTTGGTYEVIVTNRANCSSLKIINVELLESSFANVESIQSDHRDIVVSLDNADSFEYSIDGLNYQNSPLFENLLGGDYVIFVRRKNGCSEALVFEYTHIVIPRFFTPNGDSTNETFAPEGLRDVNNYSINIFDRYGKLMASSTDLDFAWDGTSNGSPMFSSDYWYAITFDDQIVKGHVTLKR